MIKPIGMLESEPSLIEPPVDSEEVRARYRYWQNRILISTIIGYALFYFVRKNLSMAMPEMEKSLGISKTDHGLFLTLHMATKRAAASAAGLTGIFGYASTAVSGVGMGAVVDRYGWNAGFMMLAGAIGIVLFALCWPARADGYQQTS